MKISIIIPCFNEEKTLNEIVNKVLCFKSFDKELIIVDDCSSDNTPVIINDLVRKYNEIKSIRHDKNFGKGEGIKSGIKISTGDIILIQDADLEYNPEDYDDLLKPFLNTDADVVYGSRFIGSNERRVLFYWHTLGNKFLTTLSNMVTNLNLTDMETCYKAFKSEVIKNIDLKEDRFGFEPEITAKIAKKNLRIFEIGIKYFGRTYKEGKKITWRDGFSALYCIIRYGFFR